MVTSKQIILGIDPGFDRCGVALIETGQTPIVIKSWCITTSKKSGQPERLAIVFRGIEDAIKQYKPDAIALETLFFSVNKKTALAVAEARGIVVTLAGLYETSLIELSPQEVKLAMTGSGNADKEAVQKMVSLTLKIDIADKLDDEVDAIAIGIAASGKMRLQALAK